MDDLEAIRGFYERYDEGGRLATGPFRLERARTVALMDEALPPPPAVILDVGGGPGAYACQLAARGYEVHLIDLMARHVEEAVARSRAQPSHPLASASVGDARALDVPDGMADAVLLLGPLYHLQSRADRLGALTEGRRVLRPGGILLAAAISRFASMLEGLVTGAIADPRFAAMVSVDLDTGCHTNPTGELTWFTDAFFHKPEEFGSEVTEAGFQEVEVRAVEGVGWLLPDFDERWADDARRARLLEWVARTDREPSMQGVSAHLLAVARAPGA